MNVFRAFEVVATVWIAGVILRKICRSIVRKLFIIQLLIFSTFARITRVRKFYTRSVFSDFPFLLHFVVVSLVPSRFGF